MRVTLLLLSISFLINCSDNHSSNQSSTNSIGINISDKENSQTSESLLDKNVCDRGNLYATWNSIEDKKYSVIITDKFFIHSYAGSGNDTLSYNLTTTIESDSTSKTCYIITKELNSDYQEIYSIYSLTKERLLLMNLDRGNILSYTRNK